MADIFAGKRADIFAGKRAAIFDMDGTLIDSIGVWNETDRLLALELTGREPDMAQAQRLRDEALARFRDAENPYLAYCGLLARRYGLALSAREIYDKRYAIAAKLLETLDVKPGAGALARRLKDAGMTLIVATTTRRRSIDVYRTKNRLVMKKLPLDRLFDRIYTAEDVERIKPDPEIYERIFADFGLTAAECLVFEDSLSGVRAAKAAGIDVVAVYDSHADPDRAAINDLSDWQIESFLDLEAAYGDL